ncbi:hypothetical protein GIB67_002003, partial [Kingdonia uniflora]
MEQLVGLPADGDATVIGGTWGFPVILEVFENNLLQNLNAFKSLKAGGAGNLLSLRKLKEHYAFKLEKVLGDGTVAAAKKKKGLTARSVACAYMLYVIGSFLFPMKKGTNVSTRYLCLFAKDKVAKKWSWGSAVMIHMYYNLGASSRDDRRLYGTHTKIKGIPHMHSERSPFFYGALASPDHVQPYYPNRVVRQFNREQGIPVKRLLIEVSNLWNAKESRKFNPKYEWVDCFSGQKWKEIILKKADRGRRVQEGPLVCTERYLEWFASILWTMIYPITVDLAADDDAGIHQRKKVSISMHHEHVSLSPNAHNTMPTRGGSGGFDQQITELNDQLQKLKEDKEKEFEANTKLSGALKEKILEYKNFEAKNTSLEAELMKKFGLEDCNQSLSVELNKKCKESESLKAVNALLMEQIDLHFSPAIPPVPNATLAKRYDDLLAAHEDVKKKLIGKEDFRKKLANAEERMKSLEVNSSEWEVWRQALKKALASEGMGDIGDLTFEELFEQNERFFTIVKQGPKGDYQEDLVSTAVTHENVVIARREKITKKKKIQELLFQPWMKYFVDVHGIEISDNNSGFRVTAAIQHQSQDRFSDTCSYGHQHEEYRHMAYLLSTYHEKVVVFITHTEAYIFLPLFWARKRNTTSNEKRMQNLLMDTSKFWWYGLGANNHYVRLFPRLDAPIPPVSTIFYSHINLEIPLAFLKEQLT